MCTSTTTNPSQVRSLNNKPDKSHQTTNPQPSVVPFSNETLHTNIPSKRSVECVCKEIAFLQLSHFKYTCSAIFPINVCDRFTYAGDEEKFFKSCMAHVHNRPERINETWFGSTKTIYICIPSLYRTVIAPRTRLVGSIVSFIISKQLNVYCKIQTVLSTIP